MDRLILLLTTAIGGLWQSPPIVVVLLLNLIPAAGVLWLGWSPLVLLLLYWFENVVLGAVNVAKMSAAARDKPDGPATAADVIPFFLLHYGMFCLVHLVFTLVIGSGVFGEADPAQALGDAWDARYDVLLAAAGVAALHGVALMGWLREQAWRTTDPRAQMAEPYGRIVVLHITILGGAFLIAHTGLPAASIVLLAVLKTAYEAIATTLRQRRIRTALEAQGRR